MFWILVILTGGIGAVADIILNDWSGNPSWRQWAISAGAYLVFMTGLGLVIRFGATGGVRLTIAVLLVVVVNVATLAIYDIYKTSELTSTQMFGILLALAAISCFEFGRAS